MSNIIIPIDSSNAREAIPPGEEIIYSTVGGGIFKTFSGFQTFTTHILMTPNGFAFTDPRYSRKGEPVHAEYRTWTDIKKISKDRIILPHGNYLKIGHFVNVEPEDSYKYRIGLFPSFILPYIINFAERIYNEGTNNPEIKEKTLRGVLSFIEQNKKALKDAQKKADKILKKYER